MDEHTYDVALTKPAKVCVGRDRELAELASRDAATATRGADVVGLVGVPGIGKSVLLHRLTEQHGGPAWWAQAATWEADTPGAVLRQLLQEPVPTEPVAAAARVAERMPHPTPRCWWWSMTPSTLTRSRCTH